MEKEVEMNHAYRSMTGLKMYIPGRSEDDRAEKIRQKNWAKEQAKIPMSIMLEIVYMFVLFFCCVISVIYLVIGLTLIGWKPSIQSITDTGRNGEPITNYDMMEGVNSKLYATFYFFDGVTMFLFSILPIYYAAFLGYKNWYYIVMAIHGMLLIGEIAVYILGSITAPDTCNAKKFRIAFTELFKWYGILSPHPKNKGHEAVDKINELQAYMGCCGIDGWHDYIKMFSRKGEPEFDEDWYPKEIGYIEGAVGLLDGYYEEGLGREHYMESGREIAVLPSSCCKHSWAHNILCADEVIRINQIHPELELPKHRLVSEGCVKVVSRFCDNLLHLFTSDILLLLILHSICFIFLLSLTYFIFRGFHKLYLRVLEAHRIHVHHESKKPRTKQDKDSDSELDYPLLSNTLLRDTSALEPGGGDGDRRRRLEEESEETLYFGPSFDQNLTEQELYESLRSKLKKRSQKLILDELHKRRRSDRSSIKSMRKHYLNDEVTRSMSKYQKSNEPPTMIPCPPPPSSVGLVSKFGSESVYDPKESIQLSHVDKLLVQAHRERKQKEKHEKAKR